jgi:tetratricopeptide (TPR) repeat protein
MGATAQSWQGAQRLEQATEADVQKGGIQGIFRHVPDLEKALAEAQPVIETARMNGVVLTDGQTETLGALLFAAAAAKSEGTSAPKSVAAAANPYPMISFFLGTYYNEIGKSAEALRALDAGLALPAAAPGLDVGDTVPLLLTERGAALEALKRPEESLANFDRGLKIEGLKDNQRAVMLRGRGFSLVELGRLDEGEQAYRDSLVAEPNNPRALNELTYIRRLRAGGPTAPGMLFPKVPTASP